MAAPDDKIRLTMDYLATHFPAGEEPKLNINKASAIELESALSLRPPVPLDLLGQVPTRRAPRIR